MTAARFPVPLLVNTAVTGDPVEWPGGPGRVSVSGTVNGAVITLKVLGADGATYDTVSAETTFSATGTAGFYLESGATIIMGVSGGSPSGLYATAYRM